MNMKSRVRMMRQVSDDDDTDFNEDRNKLRDYVKRSSILALPRAVEHFSSKFDRSVWAFLFLAGLVATIYSEYRLVYTYLQYPSQITVRADNSSSGLRYYYPTEKLIGQFMDLT